MVHWDGKLLPDVTGIDMCKVDRLPVLLSSLVDSGIKLIGVPKLNSGTGQADADAGVDLLHLWECSSLVIGMCFDTTSANTGITKGACKIIENLIGRNLLWLACRHHMFEVLLADAFSICLGPSTGPDILLFKRFREKWSKLNHHQPEQRLSAIIAVDESLKLFISNYLNKNHS